MAIRVSPMQDELAELISEANVLGWFASNICQVPWPPVNGKQVNGKPLLWRVNLQKREPVSGGTMAYYHEFEDAKTLVEAFSGALRMAKKNPIARLEKTRDRRDVDDRSGNPMNAPDRSDETAFLKVTNMARFEKSVAVLNAAVVAMLEGRDYALVEDDFL